VSEFRKPDLEKLHEKAKKGTDLDDAIKELLENSKFDE